MGRSRLWISGNKGSAAWERGSVKGWFRRSVPLLLGVGALVLAGCVSSSSGGGGCDEECVDANTGYGIIETVRYLYNSNLAGQSTGNQDLTPKCPYGGIVHITGTTNYSASTGINTVDLNLDTTGCAYTDGDVFDLTLTGSLDWNGSFSSYSSYAALTYQSGALTMSGTVSDTDVSQSCVVSITRTDGSYNGTVCGRSFSN